MTGNDKSPTAAQQETLRLARESITSHDRGHMTGDYYYWALRYRQDLERILREFEEGGPE